MEQKKTKHLGGSKEAEESSCWNDNKTQIWWWSLYRCARHPVIPVTGSSYNCISHNVVLHFALHCRDWPTCTFLCLALPSTFTYSALSPSSLLRGKSPKCSIERTYALSIFPYGEGRGRAFCQVCIPGCAGGRTPLAPGTGQPEPPVWRKGVIAGRVLGSWSSTDLI